MTITTSQIRLAHWIASLGIWTYKSLVQMMERRDPLVEDLKAMRQDLDQVYAEHILLPAYRFARTALEQEICSFELALWADLRRFHNEKARHQAERIQNHHAFPQQSALLEQEHQFNLDADRYLLEHIRSCLEGDPHAAEWESRQCLAHQHYEFWFTGLPVQEAAAWRRDHPRHQTDRLWKVPDSKRGAETPMICLPGTREYDLAQAKWLRAQMECWEARFGGGLLDAEETKKVFAYYETKGVLKEDIFLLDRTGKLRPEEILSHLSSLSASYKEAVERLRQASVHFVLLGKVDVSAFGLSTVEKDWEHFLALLKAALE